MSGWVLLVIGLASLGLVGAAFVYLAYTGYRLGKAGVRLARTYGPPVAELTAKAEAAAERAAGAGLHAQDITATLERLQATLQRLQILAEAWREATDPWRRLRSYLGR